MVPWGQWPDDEIMSLGVPRGCLPDLLNRSYLNTKNKLKNAGKDVLPRSTRTHHNESGVKAGRDAWEIPRLSLSLVSVSE